MAKELAGEGGKSWGKAIFFCIRKTICYVSTGLFWSTFFSRPLTFWHLKRWKMARAHFPVFAGHPIIMIEILGIIFWDKNMDGLLWLKFAGKWTLFSYVRTFRPCLEPRTFYMFPLLFPWSRQKNGKGKSFQLEPNVVRLANMFHTFLLMRSISPRVERIPGNAMFLNKLTLIS